MAARVSVSVLVVAVLAALVTVGALFGAWQLRATDAGQQRATSVPGARNDTCVRERCPVLATAKVASRSARLHATRRGTEGAIELPGNDRALRVTVTDVGARLDRDSLRCIDGSGGAACLVRGGSAQGEVGEVLLKRRGSWERVERPYVSSAGVLELQAIDGTASMVAVQPDCESADCETDRVYAQVFTAAGRVLGCTEVYRSKYALPGWPRVAPGRYQLGACPQS